MNFQGFLKQSTSVNVTVLMIDSTDHVTGKTGLTLTIYLTKAAGTPASISPTVTELDSTNVKGLYKLALATTSWTDTLGEVQLHVTASGADPTDVKWQVVAVDFTDSVRMGLTALPNAAANAAGGLLVSTAGALDMDELNVDIEAIQAKTDNLPVSPAAAGDAMALTSGERNSTADALLARSLGTEGYAAKGAAPTVAQAVYMLVQNMQEFSIASTTVTVKKLDGAATAMTFTLDSATTPTSRTRAT